MSGHQVSSRRRARIFSRPGGAYLDIAHQNTSPETEARPVRGAPDAELARRAATGAVEAFEELYRRHAQAARSAAYAVVGNTEDAADATSEAYSRVFQALPSGRLRDGSHFRSYLTAAARNAAIDIVRRAGRVLVTADVDELDGVLMAGPPEQVVAALDSTLVARAFRRLPERWRQVLWLTEVEGLTGKEAALLLGLSPNGVAQLAVRARAGLREGFLQAHVADGDVVDACRFTVGRLGAYAAGASSARDIAKVDQHLAGCRPCRSRLAELADLARPAVGRGRAA